MTKIIPRDLIKHLEWKPGQATAPIVDPVVQPVNTSQGVNFPDSPSESFLMSYDGAHGDYFQELMPQPRYRC